MKKCLRCNVTIMDVTNVCPLCHQVLKKNDIDPPFTGEVYPDMRNQYHVARLIQNITLFVSIVVTTILWVIYRLTHADSFLIPIIVTMVLIYGNSLLRLAILGKSNYMLKVVFGTVSTLAVLWGLDFLTGNRGWAMAVIFPGAVILLNLAIMILMIVKHRNWQSFIVLQMFAAVLSLVPMICLFLDVFHYPYFAWASFCVSIFYFLGIVIIGDRRARNELKRRFYI